MKKRRRVTHLHGNHVPLKVRLIESKIEALEAELEALSIEPCFKLTRRRVVRDTIKKLKRLRLLVFRRYRKEMRDRGLK